MDTNNRLTDLITVTGRLIELLERENDALTNRQTDVVHDLLDEKTALSRVYETRFNSLTEKPEILRHSDPKLREQLVVLAGQVEELMSKNTKLLLAK